MGLFVGGGGDIPGRDQSSWPRWVPQSISLGKVVLGSVSWLGWPPGLIAPWQVALGSVSTVQVARGLVCVPFRLTPQASCPIVLGLAAGPTFCLWVHFVFCDLCVLWTLEEIYPSLGLDRPVWLAWTQSRRVTLQGMKGQKEPGGSLTLQP